MLRFLFSAVWFAAVLSLLTPVVAQELTKSALAPGKIRVLVIPVREQIDEPIHFVVRRGLKEAEKQKVNTVVLDMHTLGGSGQSAFDIMEALGKFSGSKITYVNSQAISAGAFIAAATDEIWFAPSSVIGAAAAVTSAGQDIPETMRLKVNSFVRAKVRAVSQGKGYRGQVLEAMIDKDYELKIGDKVIKKPNELLSLTAEEAVTKYGEPPQALLGAGIAKDLDALLTAKYGKDNYTVDRVQVTWSEQLAQYLTNWQPVLLGLGMLALFIEFKTPGFGVFGIAGIVLLGIVFLSSYAAGLSGHEPILVFAIGLLLVVAEIFFFPGTAIVAVIGLCLMLGSLVWAMADIWPNQPIEVNGSMFVRPLISLGLGLVVAILGAVAVARFLPKGWLWDRMILNTAVVGNAQTDVTSAGVSLTDQPMAGVRGVAVTGLFPSGQVEIDGRRYEARVTIGSIEKGANVVVVGRSEFGLVVEKAQQA
jgi:membrane-bound serine protease (ClpP class)